MTREIYELLDEMQREYWRLERRESRHSWHIEDMRESDLPHEKYVQTPEQEMMHRLESETLRNALMELPEVQRRRFQYSHIFISFYLVRYFKFSKIRYFFKIFIYYF